MLFQSEYQRWQTGPDEYEPSWLSQKLMTALRNQIGQRYTAGLVGIALWMLPHFGRKPSLETASAVVSEYGFSLCTQKQGFVFWDSGQWNDFVKPINGDQRTIQKIFRTYRHVAHICAAEVAASEFIEPPKPFDFNALADLCFIVTAMIVQKKFESVENFSDWNLHEIVCSPPEEFLTKAVPLVPSAESVARLFGPWLDQHERSG